MKTFVLLEDVVIDDIRPDFRERFNINDEESLRNLSMTDNTSFTVITQTPINPYSTEDDLAYIANGKMPIAYASYDQKNETYNMMKYLMFRGRINASFFTIEKLWLNFCKKHNEDTMNEKIQTFINWIKDLDAEDALKMDFYENIN
jgi:hypothetical protein